MIRAPPGTFATVVLAIFASLLAAVLYAAASVLQHRAAVAVPAEHSMRLGLLTRLIAQPWWLAGIAADGLAFVMQFVALGNGPLVVVQPLLVSGLLFALPFGAWVSHKKMQPSDLWAALVVVVGLALMFSLANPGKGRETLTAEAWIVLSIAVGVPTVACAVIGARSPRWRATLLAAGAGLVYGITASLAKVTAHELGIGIGQALASWETWALIPGGVVGMLLCQSAFQAGSLAASLPTLTVVDPIASIAIGTLAFHEHLAQAPASVVLETVGLAAMIVGVFWLARSPLVALEETDAVVG
jgi:drug/metabolite transporter (DMT)-like permease